MSKFAEQSVETLPISRKLPDPFRTVDGDVIETADDWYSERREELQHLFQHFVYGYLPEPPSLTVSARTVDGVLNGTATLREAELVYDEYPDAPSITLALFLPRDRRGEVPTFLGLNSGGNHAVVDDTAVTITDGWRSDHAPPASDDGRGAMADYWAIETVLEQGYGFATIHVSDIEPDTADVDGFRAHVDLDVPDGTEWGCLAAWAWGYHRGVDYLVGDAAVDDSRIAVIGHSRLGKAALLAGALDDRIALVVPHQSGTGGMALSRDNEQETVGAITDMFPHWFNDIFPRFADREARLPVDQHLLTALVAPRPLLDTEGSRDEWTNPPSALRNLRAASAVYELLGVDGLGDDEVVSDAPIETKRIGSILQYRLDTEHTLNAAYWKAIISFADAVL